MSELLKTARKFADMSIADGNDGLYEFAIDVIEEIKRLTTELEEAQHRIDVQSSVIIGCEAKINEYREQLADVVQERNTACEQLEVMSESALYEQVVRAETERDNYYQAYQLYMERALDAEKERDRYREGLQKILGVPCAPEIVTEYAREALKNGC